MAGSGSDIIKALAVANAVKNQMVQPNKDPKNSLKAAVQRLSAGSTKNLSSNPNNNGGGGAGTVAAPASTIASLPQTAELQQLIASGLINDTTPPEQALAMIALKGLSNGVPIDVKALMDQINANYANYNGDILTSGADWMTDLMGSNAFAGLTPEQIAADPTLSAYADSMANLAETSDLNQTTDLNWFLKNQEAQQDYYDSLIAGIPMMVGTETGGGGGGGGGYGGGGYGGGGSGNGSETVSDGVINTEKPMRVTAKSATGWDSLAVLNNNRQIPGLTEDLTSLMAGNPEMVGWLQSFLANTNPSDAGDIAEAAQEAYDRALGTVDSATQGNLDNSIWESGALASFPLNLEDYLTQSGQMLVADDPETPEYEYVAEDPNRSEETGYNPAMDLGWGTQMQTLLDTTYGPSNQRVQQRKQLSPLANAAASMQRMQIRNSQQNVADIQNPEIYNNPFQGTDWADEWDEYNAPVPQYADELWSNDAIQDWITGVGADPDNINMAMLGQMPRETMIQILDQTDDSPDPGVQQLNSVISDYYDEHLADATDMYQIGASTSPADEMRFRIENLVSNGDQAVHTFLVDSYPNLTVAEQAVVDEVMNDAGIDTPGSTLVSREAENKNRLTELTRGIQRLREQQRVATVSNDYYSNSPGMRLATAGDGTYDLADQVYTQGGRLDPETLNSLQRQSVAQLGQDLLNGVIPEGTTGQPGDYYNENVPTEEEVSDAKWELNVLNGIIPIIREHWPLWNFTPTWQNLRESANEGGDFTSSQTADDIDAADLVPGVSMDGRTPEEVADEYGIDISSYGQLGGGGISGGIGALISDIPAAPKSMSVLKMPRQVSSGLKTEDLLTNAIKSKTPTAVVPSVQKTSSGLKTAPVTKTIDPVKVMAAKNLSGLKYNKKKRLG